MIVYSKYWNCWFDSETGEELDWMPAVVPKDNVLGRREELKPEPKNWVGKEDLMKFAPTFEDLKRVKKERILSDEEMFFVNYLVKKESVRLMTEEPNLTDGAYMRKIVTFETDLMKEFYGKK